MIMNSRYFCPVHIEKLTNSEQHAFSSWNELMQRAVVAHVHCRIESADIYFRSALEIALLRLRCSRKQLFSDIQLTKPLEFLIDALLAESNYSAAVRLLSRVSSSLSECVKSPTNTLLANLQHCYERVEKEEKNAMYEGRKDAEIRRSFFKGKLKEGPNKKENRLLDDITPKAIEQQQYVH